MPWDALGEEHDAVSTTRQELHERLVKAKGDQETDDFRYTMETAQDCYYDIDNRVD